MKFKSEDDAWEYWQECLYMYGGGYEPPGYSSDKQVDMFWEWVEDQGITWLDTELSNFIDAEFLREDLINEN